jgi:drug/metabolite transporter (DMT)-like permease
MQVAILATIAMTAFAANSVLCRMALRAELIDPASFTTLRLLAGTLCLPIIVVVRSRMRGRDWRPAKPVWKSVFALSAYMLCFSFAYQSLSTGSGALLLFGSVQLIMISTAIIQGERLSMLA